MDEKVRDVLVAMKAELSNGWVQGELQNDRGVCLYGSVVRTCNLPYGPVGPFAEGVKGRLNDVSRNSYYLELTRPEGKAIVAIGNEIGVSWDDLALWQDEPGRTVDDLIAVIDLILLKEDAIRELTTQPADVDEAELVQQMALRS